MIYDVLHTTPGDDTLAFLPVAAAVGAVDVQLDFTGAPFPFKNPITRQWFQPGDNVLLDKVKCTIPYGFGQGNFIHGIQIKWENQIGTLIGIPEFANTSNLDIPDLCSCLEFGNGGLFIAAPKAAQGTKFRLVLTAGFLTISMIGAPTILIDQASELDVTYWLELRHTLVLGA